MREVLEDEVARHCTEGDAWIVLDGEVFDVSSFVKWHPGGRGVLQAQRL